MSSPPVDVNHTFSDSDLEQLKAYGEVQYHENGALLTDEGTRQAEMLVTLSGFTEIHVTTPDGKKRVGWMERGQFAGDITVLTGQAALATTSMGDPGEVLHISHENFQKLLVDNSALSDAFVSALSARRAFAHEAQHSTVIVIGKAQDRSVFIARDLLAKHDVPHTWLDPAVDELARQVMQARSIEDTDLPCVIRGANLVLSKPTPMSLSEAFGLDLLPDGATADVIIVGAGPAGLAASVYAASEGLSVLTLDSTGPGGQAGTSSKIENYLGFPMGVSGRELAERASVQAQKFGTRIATPVKASAVDNEGETFCLSLEDGRKLKAKALVIATGAQYRRLPIENLERFEGRGIYYGATPMEAQLCSGSEVAVVGAGNSAGQAAVFLSQTAKAVHVVYRRSDIRETMSEYLVRRLEETSNIILHPNTEIEALHGNDIADPTQGHLTACTFKNSQSSELQRCDTNFIFLFIGAAPFTQWLPETIAKDSRGFLKTGRDLENIDLVKAGWPLERMPSNYETSWPRIYAVGDARTGSVKRVASAVGEGSVVVSDIHRALSEATAEKVG